MIKGLKLLSIFIFLIVAALPVLAQDFSITRVDVDGIAAVERSQAGNAVFVERNSRSVIEVFIRGNGTSDDVKAKTWIGGYEFGNIEDETEIFDVEPNVEYRKVLRLDIPTDIEASDDYTLHVEVFDDDNKVERTYTLRLKEKRHFLDVLDIIFRPGTSVQAGRSLFTTIRVENLGSRKEEDIKVQVSVPELGISARDYIDELVARETNDDDEEDSASSNEILLRIPDNAATGQYEVVIEVEYNRGHEVLRAVRTISVEGVEKAVEGRETIEVDATSRNVNQAEQAAYKVMIANLGKASQTYSVEVSGERLFASSRVEPNVVTVRPDSTDEVLVFLDINKDATPGRHRFVAKVMADDVIVKEFNLEANVAEKGLSESAKNTLIVVSVALAIILVILALVVAFRRMKPEGEPGEKTYY